MQEKGSNVKEISFLTKIFFLKKMNIQFSLTHSNKNLPLNKVPTEKNSYNFEMLETDKIYEKL